MKKINILYDCTVLSNYAVKNGHRAGLFFTALNLLYEMQKIGINIALYCSYTEYYKIKNIKELKAFTFVPEHSIIHNIIAYIFYLLEYFPEKLQPYVKIINRLCNKYIFIKNKRRNCYLSKFDAYFSPFTPPSKEIENLNIKKFRLIHDVIPLIENNLNNHSPKWSYWYNRVYSTINDKDFYFTNSKYTKQDVLKYFPFIKEENIKTTLLGANENFKPIDDDTILKKYNLPPKYIFSLCSLGKRKNLEFGIKNFFEFIERNNIEDLYLVLAGGIWKRFKKELNETLNKYDKNKIKVLGYVPDEDLPALYSQALMFIYPSLYEGFGLPVLEAMQCGCPVITSNTTSLPEVIGDAGIQINPTSDEEMIAAYKKMYFDNEYRAYCVEKGLERAKQFSWEKCAAEILEFIKEKCN